jgi:hypothetical protein
MDHLPCKSDLEVYDKSGYFMLATNEPKRDRAYFNIIGRRYTEGITT